jgi:hypothetical protein
VQGQVISQDSQVRWVVPRRAIMSQRIFVVDGGAVRSRSVVVDFQMQAAEGLPELGLADRDWVVLRDALPEGALVVVNTSRSLVEGGVVTPVVREGHVVRSDGGAGEEATP